MAWVNQQREAGYSPQSFEKGSQHLRGLLEYAGGAAAVIAMCWTVFRCKTSAGGRAQVFKFRRSAPTGGSLSESYPSGTPDRLVILLLYGCGLRTAELCQLDVKDADLARRNCDSSWQR